MTREEEIISRVLQIIQDLLNPKRIILFGSRATANHHPHADFDFAVDGPPSGLNTDRKLREKIDAIRGLYKIDLVYLQDVDVKFRRLIERTGKVLYER